MDTNDISYKLIRRKTGKLIKIATKNGDHFHKRA